MTTTKAHSITCPDCGKAFRLAAGDDGGVCCLSYIYADGRVIKASNRAESAAVYRTVLDEARAAIGRPRVAA